MQLGIIILGIILIITFIKVIVLETEVEKLKKKI